MTDTLIIMVISFEKNKLEHLFRLVVVGYPFFVLGHVNLLCILYFEVK